MREHGEIHPELTDIERRIAILKESGGAYDELARLDQLQEERGALEYDLEGTDKEQHEDRPSGE
jgi:hypothetical protein